ncbi:MAG: hypothetical protein HC883_02285 [Bdellovibrionaceae bacterium]|nr:hypothetical protein [Pseudobdellovibrionaceae bacterium]
MAIGLVRGAGLLALVGVLVGCGSSDMKAASSLDSSSSEGNPAACKAVFSASENEGSFNLNLAPLRQLADQQTLFSKVAGASAPKLLDLGELRGRRLRAIITRERLEAVDNMILAGYLEGDPESSITLVQYKDTLAGNFLHEGKRYEILPRAKAEKPGEYAGEYSAEYTIEEITPPDERECAELPPALESLDSSNPDEELNYQPMADAEKIVDVRWSILPQR